MLVQLSPWQTIRTSIPLPTGSGNSSQQRKRGKGDKKQHGDDHDNDDDDGDSRSSSSHAPLALPIAASLVLPTSKRRQTKRSHTKHSTLSKSDSSEQASVPVLALTSAHRVTVIGRSAAASDSTDTSSSTTTNLGHQYKEFTTHMQYHSRPGGAGSFFPASSIPARKNGRNGSSSGAIEPVSKTLFSLPLLPALVDPQQDRVFAFQHNNTRLCCWRAWTGSGPDERTITLHAQLTSPALSVRVLPMPHRQPSVVYGSCQNGDVFVARIITTMQDGGGGGDESLLVEYLPVPGNNDNHNNSSPEGHIGTLAEIVPTAVETQQSDTYGKRRKTSDAEGSVAVSFYQVYGKAGDLSLTLVRHDILVGETAQRRAGVLAASDSRIVDHDSLVQRTTMLALPQGNGSWPCRLVKALLVVSAMESAPQVALVYTTAADSHKNGQHTAANGGMDGESTGCRSENATFGAILSLSRGELSSCPVKFPSLSHQFGFALGSLFAAATEDAICFYNLKTGALLQCKSIKTLGVSSKGSAWLMMSDKKNGTVAIIVAKDDELYVSCSTIRWEEDVEQTQQRVGGLKSSAILASALLAASRRNVGAAERFSVRCLVSSGSDTMDVASSKQLNGSVGRALEMLDNTRKSLFSDSDHQKQSGPSFVEVFRACVSSQTTDVPLLEPIATIENGESHHNPKDPSGEENVQANGGNQGMNGVKMSPKTVILPGVNMPRNGIRQTVHIVRHHVRLPPSIAQPLIDGSMQIVLSAIRLSSKSMIVDEQFRYVMKTLLLSGKISARLHFEGTYPLQGTSMKHPLASILEKLEQNSSAETTVSPVDLIVLMLRKCSDISERQLVVMLDFMMRHASAGDVSAAFYGFNKKSIHCHYSLARLPTKETSAGNEVTNGNFPQLNDQGSSRSGIILEGVKRILEMAVCYSECNESMLRMALMEGVSSSTEAAILARMLSDMLISAIGKISSAGRLHKQQVVRSICQWTAALCDSFRDDLTCMIRPSGETYLEFMHNSTQQATRAYQALIACNKVMGLAEARGKRKRKTDVATNAGAPQKRPRDEDVPGYSIDRLVF